MGQVRAANKVMLVEVRCTDPASIPVPTNKAVLTSAVRLEQRSLFTLYIFSIYSAVYGIILFDDYGGFSDTRNIIDNFFKDKKAS